MGQFDPHFTPVGHPAWSGTVMGQQWRKHKVQAGGYYISSLVGVQTTGVQMAGPSCWPPIGKCASVGFEGHKCLRALCIAQGGRCDGCGSRDHLKVR